jgi:hypothetical protein
VERLTEINYVTVNLPEGRDFNAGVVAVVGSTAALKPIGFLIYKLPERIDEVLVSFVSESRLIGLKGSLVRDRNILRFSVVDGVQKRGRRSTRIPIELPVSLTRVESGERAEGTTINIATEGVLLRSELGVATGDVLGLELALADAPLTTRGRVVRHADGLVAVELARDAHATVAEYVIAEKLRAQPV